MSLSGNPSLKRKQMHKPNESKLSAPIGLFWLYAILGLIFLNLVYISMVGIGRSYLEISLESEVLKRETRLTQNMIDFVRRQVAKDMDDLDLVWLSDPLLSFQTVLEPAIEFSDLLLGIRHYNTDGSFLQSFPSSQSEEPIGVDIINKLSKNGGEAVFMEQFDLSKKFISFELSGDSSIAMQPVVIVRLPISGDESSMSGGIVEFYQTGTAFMDERSRILDEIRTKAQLLVWTGCFLITFGSFIFLFFLYKSQVKTIHHSRELMKANGELLRYAKSSALGSISAHLIHGLRGPLAGLKQFIEFGKSDSKKVNQSSWNDAEISMSKLKKLVDDVVYMIQDEKSSASGTLSIRDLFETINGKFLGEGGSRIRIMSDKESILSQEVLIRNWNLLVLVLTNLIENSIDAGGSETTVKLSANLSDGMVECRVVDDAGGIPDHLISKLFEPKVSRKAAGSGIGLAISRQLMSQAGGDLVLESSDASGSVFLASIPRNGI